MLDIVKTVSNVLQLVFGAFFLVLFFVFLLCCILDGLNWLVTVGLKQFQRNKRRCLLLFSQLCLAATFFVSPSQAKSPELDLASSWDGWTEGVLLNFSLLIFAGVFWDDSMTARNDLERIIIIWSTALCGLFQSSRLFFFVQSISTWTHWKRLVLFSSPNVMMDLVEVLGFSAVVLLGKWCTVGAYRAGQWCIVGAYRAGQWCIVRAWHILTHCWPWTHSDPQPPQTSAWFFDALLPPSPTPVWWAFFHETKAVAQTSSMFYPVALGGFSLFLVTLFMLICALVRSERTRNVQMRDAELHRDIFRRGMMHVQLEAQQPVEAVRPGRNSIFVFFRGELAAATHNFSATIGAGGSGSVFKATGLQGLQVGQGSEFAVKKINRENMQGQGEFLQEVQVLGGCKHENLLPLLGFSADGGDTCLVFPLMVGGSLDDRLFRGSEPLSWQHRLQACLSVALALDYLHTEDVSVHKPAILHRDLKPANILLDADGLVRVADVGLAKMLPPHQSHVTLDVSGTLGYIDPEYVQTGRYTPASDAYALGVTMLVLLTGVPAINSEGQSVIDLCRELPAEQVRDHRAAWPADTATELLRIALALTEEQSVRASLPETIECLQRMAGARPGGCSQAASDPAVPAKRDCVLCMTNLRTVRLGCGHAAYCGQCLVAVLARANPVCPYCRVQVNPRQVVEHNRIAQENTFVNRQPAQMSTATPGPAEGGEEGSRGGGGEEEWATRAAGGGSGRGASPPPEVDSEAMDSERSLSLLISGRRVRRRLD